MPDSTAHVVTTTIVPGNGSTPEYCNANGYIDYPRHLDQLQGKINFNLQLPMTGWNGHYVQVGNGGFSGAVPTAASASPYLARGAAVGSDDDGHIGAGLNASFGQIPQDRIVFAYLAEHLMSETGKVVATAFYGREPSGAYFIGCSTGGYQALQEAQRYPADFNSIVAGDPANITNYLAPVALNYRERANRTTTPDHSIILAPAKASVVANAVVSQCTRDGDVLPGGIVTDPRLCPFDVNAIVCPAGASDTSNCLTPAEADVVRKWYDSPRTSTGTELYPGGEPLGSENGWPGFAIGTNANYSPAGTFADQFLHYLAFPQNPPAAYQIYDFNFDQDVPDLAPMASVYDAANPNLTAFRNRGGKLILYHGYSDPLITPYQTIQYYEDVIDETSHGDLKATQSWFRLFMLPGVYHCGGGPGPSTIDFYSAVDNWARNGVAPSKLIASTNPAQPTQITMPIYPYPLDTRYVGGDINNPGSYAPASAPRGRDIEVSGLIKYPHARTGFIVDCLELDLCQRDPDAWSSAFRRRSHKVTHGSTLRRVGRRRV